MSKTKPSQSHTGLDRPVNSLPKKLTGKLAEQAAHVNTLRIFVVLLVLVVCFLILVNFNQQRHITVHIPPDTRNGATLQVGEIPMASVFNNTVYLWQSVNTWQKDGSKDAINLVDSYTNYLSSSFSKQLKEEYLRNASDIRGRERRMYLIEGGEFNPKRVIPLDEKSWVVYVDAMVEESLDGTIVKQVAIRYPLIARRVDIGPDLNPIGLQLSGFYEAPRRIGG